MSFAHLLPALCISIKWCLQMHAGMQVMGLVQQCWKQLPVERPTMKAVCETLEFIIRDIDARVRGKTTQRTK